MTNKDFLQSLGMELKVARIRRNIKQNELANITGLSEAVIAYIESGKRDSKILSYKRIADALGVKLNEII